VKNIADKIELKFKEIVWWLFFGWTFFFNNIFWV